VDRKTHEFDDKEHASLERQKEMNDYKESLRKEGGFFVDSDMADVKGRLINEFRERGQATKGKPDVARKQVEWMDNVVRSIPEIMLNSFAGRKWQELSLNAQKFVIGMAKRHVMAQADGATNTLDKIIKDKVKERTETLC
jgi:hypothetical protein